MQIIWDEKKGCMHVFDKKSIEKGVNSFCTFHVRVNFSMQCFLCFYYHKKK